MIAIEYEQVSKQFQTNAKPSVNRVSARIDEGEFITILGSSGCGKTTLLKMTNRILDPSEGRILLFGEDISTVDPVTVRRRMGYVIQQIGLFPHMTVEENIAVIPKLMKQDKGQVLNRTRELMSMVELDPDSYAKRYPSELSGGQQQRVGLARALMPDPKIMLLDEPFGAVDAITRTNLQNELLRIHSETKKTFLLVTHDINEAMLTKDGLTFSKIVLAVGRSDLRKGIDGLSTLVSLRYGIDTLEKDTLFLFCGTRLDRIKGLLWTGDRYVLLYIRLSDGRFQWPRNAAEARCLTGEEFARLMDGFSIDPSVGPKRIAPETDPKKKRKR